MANRMAKYINKDKLINLLNDWLLQETSTEFEYTDMLKRRAYHIQEMAYLNMREAINAVMEQPSTDVQTRKTAEWIYGEKDGTDGWYCSECKFHIPWYSDYYGRKNSDFIRDFYTCPHCDAKMMKYTGMKGELDEGKVEKSKDVQPVVQCKYCKHSTEWYGNKRRCFLWHKDGIDVFDDGYCNYWERGDDEQNDRLN